jgi:acyl-homoserine-lactone acylase
MHVSPRHRFIAACAAVTALAITAPAAQASASPAGPARQAGYQATITRTAYGIPHITARDFGSLGYGYGFALASDDLCTMANAYITVEGQRSRYFGAGGSYVFLPGDTLRNVGSDIFWQSVIDRHVIPRLLAVRTGPGAVRPQLRQLISGYVAGYNHYLASVGGAQGVPDPACRGKPWVKPITTLDAYLMVYEVVELEGQAFNADDIAAAQPPAAGPSSTGSLPAAALTARAASAVRTRPGAGGLPSVRQLRGLGRRLSDGHLLAEMGSNAIAIGSAGTRDHRHGMVLGNPHFTWSGPGRFYEVQLTVPGVMNVEGASFYGVPLVLIGFTKTMAWSQTSSSASVTSMPYQLTLVPGHPTEYIYNGKPVAMTHQTVTVQERAAGGKLRPFRRTVYFTRYGPAIAGVGHLGLTWSTTTAFALADANAGNLRFLNSYLATDEARSAAQELSILKRYEGLPWFDTLAADSTGHALYADILAIPDVTNAEAKRCDTALGKVSFARSGLPILDGSRPSCAWGTNKDSAAPGILGGSELPVLMRRDFTENSNDSYWMTNPAHPLTGFPRVVGQAGINTMGAAGADLGLRTRDALTKIIGRIRGTDGLGPPGFTFGDMKNLFYADTQYGATLVKTQLVHMCRSFPGGRAPTSTGTTIGVGDSCHVLATWNGTENPTSRGALLFQTFWCPFEVASKSPGALCGATSPWTHPFQASGPVHTPYGLDTTSKTVQQAFGDALAAFRAAHLPYDVPVGAVQYITLDGKHIPLPGGPGDPNGELNAIYQFSGPGSVPLYGSSYVQVVTWKTGDPCPQAATVLTYSESDNRASAHYDDQTELFSHRGWVTAGFCPAQIAAHAESTTVLRGR